MAADSPNALETDPRFPTGKWTGYFLQKTHPGKHMMELRLTFQQGVLTGDGRDRVGEFLIKGRYDAADGKCYWTKKYLGKHDVFYQGYGEEKGIWGVWEITLPGHGTLARGGFHIWPEGLGAPTNDHLTAEAEVPGPQEGEFIEIGAPNRGFK